MKFLTATFLLICLLNMQVIAQPGDNPKKGTITVRKDYDSTAVKKEIEENQITNLSIWDAPVKNNITFNFRYFTYLSLGPSYQRVFKIRNNTALLTGINTYFLMEDSAYSIGVPFELHFNNKPPIIKNFSYGVDFAWYKKFDLSSVTISPKIGFNIMGSPLSVWYGKNINVSKSEIPTINKHHITLRYNIYF